MPPSPLTHSVSWIVHKFGGSSLANADCFRRVAGLLLDYRDPRIGVVVSAMGGMTDALLRLTFLAEQDDPAYAAKRQELLERLIRRDIDLRLIQQFRNLPVEDDVKHLVVGDGGGQWAHPMPMYADKPPER